MNTNRVHARIYELSDIACKKAIHEVLETLLDQVAIEVEDEESARELLAQVLSAQGRQVTSNDIMPPSADLGYYSRRCMLIMADDPTTSELVESVLDQSTDERQMFVDPITGAVVLGALIGFLQLKFNISFKRKDGKGEFEFSLGKEATTDETISKVVDAVVSPPTR